MKFAKLKLTRGVKEPVLKISLLNSGNCQLAQGGLGGWGGEGGLGIGGREGGLHVCQYQYYHCFTTVYTAQCTVYILLVVYGITKRFMVEHFILFINVGYIVPYR